MGWPIVANKKIISQDEMHSFFTDYYSTKETKEYGFLRFGQAFFYCFRDKGMNQVTDPELFYCEDEKKAMRLICERYIID